MLNDKEKIEKLNSIRSEFRAKMSVLQKAKHSLMKLFRKKLEEKKLEDLRDNLLKK